MEQVAHVRAERDLMCNAASGNEWVVQLYYSFDDDEFLYLVMDYLPGGDLMTLLQREDILSHEVPPSSRITPPLPPTPCTPHPTPHTLHPTPYTIP